MFRELIIKREAGADKALEVYAQLKKAKIISLDESITLTAADISLEYCLPPPLPSLQNLLPPSPVCLSLQQTVFL